MDKGSLVPENASQEAIISLLERVTTQQQRLSHLEIKYQSKKHICRSLESELEALDELTYQLIAEREELMKRNKDLGDKVNKLRYEIDSMKFNRNDMKSTFESLTNTIEKMKNDDKVMKLAYDKKLSERKEIIERFHRRLSSSTL
jgi:chromosome segregation ATPase